MESTVKIITRFSRLSDKEFDQIILLDTQDFPQPWSSSQWSEYLSKDEGFVLSLLQIDNQIIGFSLFDILEFEAQAHLLKICVDSQSRIKGLGTVLLEESVKNLQKRGLSNIYLEVSVENQGAIALYEKFGFKNLCRKKKFYSNGEDAYAMQCFFK